MTKEEAISVFKDKLSWANQNRYPYVSQREAEAYRMGIKVLEQEPKTGRWVYRIYGGFHEQGDWYCSHCDYQFNYGNGHAKYCPECGYEMSEPLTEEVVGDRDYDWIIRR